MSLMALTSLQEFHLDERFLLWHFRRHSVRQPHRISVKPGSEGHRLPGNKTSRPQSLPMELSMIKSPTRESPLQTNEEPSQRHRNVYDYNGEYEFPTVQHWTAPTRAGQQNRDT